MPLDVQVDSSACAPLEDAESEAGLWSVPTWLYNLNVLWISRRSLAHITAIAFCVSLAIVLAIPNMYESQARIMPPEVTGTNSTLLAALAGRSTGNDALEVLAMSLLGGHNSGALLVDLLQSSSVSSSLMERFELQHVYHKRYRVDAAKVLSRRTKITQDKKSGVLTIAVQDTDRMRARELVQAYLDQLDVLVTRTSRSSAHQERVFIESRLIEVKDQLTRAQEALSEFSSSHAAIDLKEQARATVESQARVQGELIAAQSELDSLRQLYGDGNVRVREVEARIASIQGELNKMGGSAAPLASSTANANDPVAPYLPLRQVPRLAVPYANLYREVQVQETVYSLLTQQYEIARIQEAKDIPVVNVIDAPGIPEKKSFPPRTLLSLALTLLTLIVASLIVLVRHYWLLLDPRDARRVMVGEVLAVIRSIGSRLRLRGQSND